MGFFFIFYFVLVELSQFKDKNPHEGYLGCFFIYKNKLYPSERLWSFGKRAEETSGQPSTISGDTTLFPEESATKR